MVLKLSIFDLLYFRKPGRLEELRVNWDQFDDNDRREFKETVVKSGSDKIKKELKKLKW